MYNGQAEQDKFVLNILKEKKSGFFVEIGSNHPININNTYILETKYQWKGIMIEYEKKYLPLYKQHRPNSAHIIYDATQLDYKKMFEAINVPLEADYLQVDLEAYNGSTMKTLQKLDNEIFDKYKFATVTFENDICHTNIGNLREVSRNIFKNRGYVCVFQDIHNREPQYVYEDWYVHPDLVDMNYVNQLINNNSEKYVDNPITQKSINWQDISYAL